MRNYRIAYFTADWNSELVEQTMQGLKRFTREHENVQIYVFDCFGNNLDNERGRIKYSIFNLADLDRCDALIIQGNQIVLRDEREHLARRVAQTHIPAITIDCPIEGCVLLGIDNRQAQYDITEHVIKEHNARRLVYLTGIMDNGSPSAVLRREGFQKACEDYSIPKEDCEIIECSWRTEDGAGTARRWIEEGKPLPDAFVCANDEMALGMLDVLGENGIRVPQDVILVGFDDVSSASLASPQLASVHRSFSDATYLAAEMLLKMIHSEPVPEFIPLPYRIVPSESCGCPAAVSFNDIRKKYFSRSQFLKRFHSLQGKLIGQLLNVSSLSELMDVFCSNSDIFSCDGVYLCINDYYFDNYDKEHWHHDTTTFGDNMVLAQKDPASSNLIFRRFNTVYLLPKDILRENRFMIFYPLHYDTYSIGYLAISGISAAAEMNLHESLFHFLEVAIENVRKKSLLRHLNHVLDDLYVRDRLTGLYNRFGYERFAEPTYEDYLIKEGAAQIIFVDLDNLKVINDRCGHESGDEAIRDCAEILKAACGPDDFLMRYGGDEFLVIASPAEVHFEDKVQRAVEEKNEEHKHQYTLGMSVGSILVDASQNPGLEAAVKDADALMYKVKKERKKARG